MYGDRETFGEDFPKEELELGLEPEPQPVVSENSVPEPDDTGPEPEQGWQ